ncbi:membrane-associated zinc metalloprotease [Lachnospiraceae bacterium KM106-2]|nr:membrane-associated zinc metalloprotease [Lachnospiraceae bacterium KM106-2]
MKIIIALLVLSVIVIVHEFGHFLLAKKNGITVNEFSVGMGPRLWSHQGKETRYSLKLLPIGGSCMMLGEDETSDDPGAFNKKGVWQRISVIAAGPIFNFILAFVVSMFFIGAIGYAVPTVTDVMSGYAAKEAGLQKGDVITKIGSTSIDISDDVDIYFLMNPLNGEPVDITYERDGKEYHTSLTPKMYEKYMLGFSYAPNASDIAIGSVTSGGSLAKAGLKAGDIINSINGTSVTTPQDLSAYLDIHPLTSKEVMVGYNRGGKDYEVKVTPTFSSKGYTLGLTYNQYHTGRETNPVKIMKYGYYEMRYTMRMTLGSLKMLVTGNVHKDDVAGPVGIVNMIGTSYESAAKISVSAVFIQLAYIIILFSTNLGVMNLLPIPALDGGRLVFLLIEAIRGKPVNPEKEGMVHLAGFIFLMFIMVLVMFNDISNIIH